MKSIIQYIFRESYPEHGCYGQSIEADHAPDVGRKLVSKVF